MCLNQCDYQCDYPGENGEPCRCQRDAMRMDPAQQHHLINDPDLKEPDMSAIFDREPVEVAQKAKTDKVGTGLTMVPMYSVMEIGKIFVEGLRYGKDNWKKGVNDPDFQEERLEHALLHLMKWKEGDRSENHLAKVAWFCCMQLELERLERLKEMKAS